MAFLIDICRLQGHALLKEFFINNFERKTKLKRRDLLRFTETNPWNIPPFFFIESKRKGSHFE